MFFLIGFTCLSCSSQNLVLVDSNDMTKNYEVFNSFVDKYDAFKDIENRSNYKIYAEDEFFYLEGLGFNKAQNKVIFRIKFTKFESNKLISAISGESCTGVDCEQCAFKKSGGCECQRGVGPFGAGSCNHTITR